MCKCMEKAGKSVVTKTIHMQQVMCMNCEEPIKAKNNKLYPAHRVPIKVTEEQVKLWEEEGYEIESV